MTHTPLRLDPLDPALNLEGLHLIEASAGTGKTYTLQTLFLRLLLEKRIDIRNILVVTFSRAAAKDLRDKLRRILQAAHLACAGRMPDHHPDAQRVRAVISLAETTASDPDETGKRTAAALLDFDLAPIQTIHAFCQRLLRRYAFACGQNLELPEPEASNQQTITTLCQDWFRRHCYTPPPRDTPAAPPDFTFEQLHILATRAIAKPMATVHSDSESLTQAVLDIKEAYRVRQQTAREISFDDLLANLHRAFTDPERGTALRQAVRTEFKAGLIDEFQDTDPLQWNIFKHIFPDQNDICFIVGDPKQAIYAFRNGDIQTYLKAAENASQRFQLNKNYRSESNYIRAINEFFADTNDPTFENPQITYAGDLEAQGRSIEQSLLIGANPDPQPLKILQYKKGQDNTDGCCARTAIEIIRFLNDSDITLAGRRPQPEDIAVLCITNSDATLVLKELTSRGIPAIRLRGISVWKSTEAASMLDLLAALVNPRDPGNLGSFLLTPWGGLTPEQLLTLRNDQGLPLGYALPPSVQVRQQQQNQPQQQPLVTFADLLQTFADLHETWLKQGFSACMRQTQAALNLPNRLLATPGGEQALANLRKLTELVQQEISQRQQSLEELLAWARNSARETDDNDENSAARKANDRNAVRILTIHTSKGLEFPVVFIPKLEKNFSNSNDKNKILEYHLTDGSPHFALNVKADDKVTGSRKNKNNTPSPADQDAENNAQTPTSVAESEKGQEQLRLIYVALTRSIHRTTILSPLPDDNKAKKTIQTKFTRLLQRWQKRQTQSEASAIALISLDDTLPDIAWVQPSPQDSLQLPPPLPAVDRRHGFGSFSSLKPAHDHQEKHARQNDDEAGDNDLPTFAPTNPDPSEAGIPTIFSFPAGEQTGTCWHAILENLPFQADADTCAAVCREHLALHGFLRNEHLAETRCQAVASMIQKVLAVPLPGLAPGASSFALNQVKPDRQVKEWAFAFATPDTATTEQIKQIIAADPEHRPFIDDLAANSWKREIPGGFLTGFVDLWFEFDQRFYIIDWKSNRRNGKPEDFTRDGVRQEMSACRYWLQYLLYSIALHQFLQENLAGYDYERHFGGVHYLFLRGIDSSGGGIFAARPRLELLDSLGRLLLRPPSHTA